RGTLNERLPNAYVGGRGTLKERIPTAYVGGRGTLKERIPTAHGRGRGTLKKRLPTVIIIGVAKCGTGALRDILSIHPNIVAPYREINYFNNNKHYEQGLKYYRNMMPRSYEDQITIEKTPKYFENPETAN
ncbi:unnamed protein product, partial [Meganyctiphanes norvegica]